jgi:hypothetical protein
LVVERSEALGGLLLEIIALLLRLWFLTLVHAGLPGHPAKLALGLVYQDEEALSALVPFNAQELVLIILNLIVRCNP